MKIMEILKLWIRCVAASGQIKQRPIALRTLVILARAAQEYYTSGLYHKDFIDELQNKGSTHPYIYDGTPYKPQGLEKIINRYNIDNQHRHIPESLARSLGHDISYDNSIKKDGNIDYSKTRWPKSATLQTWYCDLNPQDGLPVALGKMLAASRQK